MTGFLETLSPRVVPVEVTLSYGTKVTVNMYTMTMHTWDELGDSVIEPTAPFVNYNSRGEEIRNYADPSYLKARRQAESERAFRRLTYALLKAENVIPGTLFDEQVKEVQSRLDLPVASALMRWQAALIAESRARVLDARHFRDVGTAEAEGEGAPQDSA